MSAKITGVPELDSVINAINKKRNKTLISLGPTQSQVKRVTTGSITLDTKIGGGWPIGRIVEIFGGESTGKTTLCLNAMKNIEDLRDKLWPGEDRYPLIVDLEHSIAADFLQSIGLDVNRILWTRPETAEEAFNSMLELTATGKISVALLDSVDAAQSEAQLRKDVGESNVGGVSKLMSDLLRRYSKLCDETQTLALFINQIRDNPGAGMYANPETTPGGKALKFYSSIRLKTFPMKPSTDVPGAGIMRIKVIKNKTSSPTTDEISFDCLYGKGPDPYIDIINCAKSLEVLVFAGPAVKIKWTEGQVEKLAVSGRAGLLNLLRTDKDFYTKLYNTCIEVSQNKKGVVDESGSVDEESPESAEQS